MKLKILTICLTLLAGAGCGNSPQKPLTDECRCRKFEEFMKFLREENVEGRVCSSENEDESCYVDNWEDLKKCLFAAAGCIPPCETLENGWQACLTLEQIWPEISSSKVRQIILCYTSDTGANKGKWYDDFEVPNEAIPGTIQLLGKALKEAKRRGLSWDLATDIWDINRMKIVTDKGTYTIPVNWTNKTIHGNDWTSPELRAYLRNYKLLEPGEKQ